MSTGHSYTGGVKESNSDVTSGLSRLLVTETISGQNLENHKTLKSSRTILDRRIQCTETKEPTSVGLSDDLNSATWHRLLSIPASGPFCQNEKALTRKQ
jgi:hypothetical protein